MESLALSRIGLTVRPELNPKEHLAQVSQSRAAVPSGVEGERAVCVRCCARLPYKKRRGIRGDTLSIFAGQDRATAYAECRESAAKLGLKHNIIHGTEHIVRVLLERIKTVGSSASSPRAWFFVTF